MRWFAWTIIAMGFLLVAVIIFNFIADYWH